MRTFHLAMLTFFSVLWLSGCSSQSGPTPAGKAVLLKNEPSNAQDVAAYKINCFAGLGLGKEATVVGRVRSGVKEPWETDRATFLVASADSGSHDHGGGDHSDCKFCQAKEMESIVLVRVVDESGAIMQTDARELLGLRENQVVVAQGQGILDGDALVFDASRIFIREQ